MGKWLVWLKTVGDLIHFLCLSLRPRGSLAAENLFLRKQLAFYQERKIKPRRTDNPTRLTLVLLSRWFDWRTALTIVKRGGRLARHRFLRPRVPAARRQRPSIRLRAGSRLCRGTGSRSSTWVTGSAARRGA